MKYLYLVLISIFSFSGQLCAQEIVETAYFAENPELGGEAVIQKSIQTFDKDKTNVTFYIDIASAGYYYANFWLCPSMKEKGVFSDYSVKVNETCIGTISPQKGGWQSIGLKNDHQIFLNKGKNTITIIGEAPVIPNVEHVKIAS